MGYVATSLDAPTAKKAVFEAEGAYVMYTKKITGTTYGTVYKQTIDFTDIDYLEVFYTTGASADHGSYKLSIDGTQKFEDAVVANGNDKWHTIDCTSLTGSLVLLFEVKNSVGASSSWLHDFSMYCRET